MRFTAIATATFTVFTSTVMADNCYKPWNWCGWDLLNHGDYYDFIQGHLRNVQRPTDDWTVRNSIWRCTDDSTGEIDFVALCENGCSYGGSDKSNDYCAPVTRDAELNLKAVGFEG